MPRTSSAHGLILEPLSVALAIINLGGRVHGARVVAALSSV
jgi:hypothetical protein